MIPVLLIAIPLIGGLAGFFIKNRDGARSWSLVVSLATLAVSLWSLGVARTSQLLHGDYQWLPDLGSRFAVGLDGMGFVLTLLTAISFPIIFIATWRDEYRGKSWNFYALMLLSQAGLMGVFLAMDALVFYFFWELALIPVYFLCSQWGGERRIQATFKFFVYTFLGSLLMLVGIIWLWNKTPDHSFALQSFYKLRSLTGSDQMWIFWMMFAAFAIKMPIWPLHTWQPDAYEQSPTAATMVLSGIMVKMGLFGILRWLAPVIPAATWAWGDTVSLLCVVGMIYASLVAIQQDDLKRLIAYSSIAHIGLMCLAIFATNATGMQGVMIQMFSHGINIIGMWIVVDLIERQMGTRKISQLGGLATKAPTLAILLVVVALANVALPLTNAFIGEFLLFSGIFTSTATEHSGLITVTAGLTIILGAVYTLNMIQRVFFGETNALTSTAKDIKTNEKMVLAAIVVLILVFGVYPKPMLDLTKEAVETIVTKMNYKL